MSKIDKEQLSVENDKIKIRVTIMIHNVFPDCICLNDLITP